MKKNYPTTEIYEDVIQVQVQVQVQVEFELQFITFAKLSKNLKESYAFE